MKNPKQKTCSIHLIAETTGMAPHDIAETLHRLGMIERDPETEKWKILRRPDLLNAFIERQKTCTRWTLKINEIQILNEVKNQKFQIH